MKIAHVTSSLGHEGAGLRTVVEALSSVQIKSGHEVRVFGLKSPGWCAGDQQQWTGASATAYSVIGPQGLGVAPALMHELIRFRPQVIHVHGLWTWPSLAALRASRKLGVGRVVSPHGMLDAWAMSQSSLKKSLALRFFERRNLEGSTIHALCKQEANSVRALGLRAPIQIIPNGVSIPDLKATPVLPPPWAGQIPANSKIILFLGRIHPKKGLEAFIDAMAIQRGAIEAGGWHLVVAGWAQDGYETVLEQKLEAHRLSHRVHFVGPVFGAEKASALAGANLFILPSFSEGLPMTVLEAWAHSLPVLITPQCNLPEGPAAMAAWEANPAPADLAERLGEIMELSPDVLAKTGQAGLKLVNQQFTWFNVAAKFERAYIGAIKRSRLFDAPIK